MVTLMMRVFRFWRQVFHTQFGHGLRPGWRWSGFRVPRALPCWTFYVVLGVLGTRYLITVVLTGVLDLRALTTLFFIRIIESIVTSPRSNRLPLSSERTLTVNTGLKNLDHVAHFLVIILLFGYLNIGYFVSAWSKLASCFRMGQSVGLVHILNELKRGTVQYSFDAGLLIERVVGTYSQVSIVVHLILNINS